MRVNNKWELKKVRKVKTEKREIKQGKNKSNKKQPPHHPKKNIERKRKKGRLNKLWWKKENSDFIFYWFMNLEQKAAPERCHLCVSKDWDAYALICLFFMNIELKYKKVNLPFRYKK